MVEGKFEPLTPTFTITSHSCCTNAEELGINSTTQASDLLILQYITPYKSECLWRLNVNKRKNEKQISSDWKLHWSFFTTGNNYRLCIKLHFHFPSLPSYPTPLTFLWRLKNALNYFKLPFWPALAFRKRKRKQRCGPLGSGCIPMQRLAMGEDVGLPQDLKGNQMRSWQ